MNIKQHFDNLNTSNEYELVFLEKGYITYKHIPCGTIIKKTKQNFRVRPGCSNKDCKITKTKQTLLNRYGINNIPQLDSIKEKKEQTCLKNNGVKSGFQLLEKRKQTCLEKYGVDNPMKNQEIRKKSLNSFFEKRTEYIKQKYPDLILNNDFKGNRKNDINKLIYIKYQFKCKTCGNIFFENLKNEPNCPYCFPIEKSKPEKELQDWLNISLENRNKRFIYEEKKFYELDIYIPEKNFGIELDGIYWHSEISGQKDKTYHKNKTEFFEKQGIQILHFWDSEWNNKKDIIKSIINNKLGLSNQIYARKCKIKEIDSKYSNEFLNNNHLQGEINSSVNIGLFYENELVSLLNIGKSRLNKYYQYEIYRFCNKLNINVVGGFSRLLKYFITKYKPKSMITYADRRYSNGGLYKSNGFNLLRLSDPNYFYTKNHKDLESRNKYQKHKLKDLLENFDENLTETQNMFMNGYDRVWDCGNYVFEYNIKGGLK